MPESEVTIMNIKQEIFDALNQAKARTVAADKGWLNPQADEHEQIEKMAIISARESVERKIFSKELNDKYIDLQTAIAAEERRLQELFGVGRELQALALAIEARNQRVTEIEKNLSQKEAAAKDSLSQLETEYEQRKAELQSEHNAIAKRLKIERTREAEEYQYNLNRTREKESNAWADEKAAREAEILKREAQADELLALARSKTEYIKSLGAKVEDIPNLIASEREAAINATTEKLRTEYDHRAALAELERKSAISRLEDRIFYLEKEMDNYIKTEKLLQDKLDRAYSEMHDLATKIIEAAD